MRSAASAGRSSRRAGAWCRSSRSMRRRTRSTGRSTGVREDATRVIPTLSVDSAWTLERDARWFGRNVRQTLEPRLLYVNTPYRAAERPAELRFGGEGLQLRIDLQREPVLGCRPRRRRPSADRRPDDPVARSGNRCRDAAARRRAALPVSRPAHHARPAAVDPALLRRAAARLDLAGPQLELRRGDPVQPRQHPDRALDRRRALLARPVSHRQRDLSPDPRPDRADGDRLAVAGVSGAAPIRPQRAAARVRAAAAFTPSAGSTTA